VGQETQDRLARRRVETKIRISGDEASRIVSQLPASGERRGDIVTVYLDRPDGLLARRALTTPQEAVKVRVRDYMDGSPLVWLEVKERRQGWVHKARLPLPRESVDAVLRGILTPMPSCRCEDCMRALRETLTRLSALSQGPWTRVGAVSVRRRTFYFDGAPLRVTLDEDVRYFRLAQDPFAEGRTPTPDVLAPPVHRDPQAILEVKHAGVLPDWWGDVAPTEGDAGPSKFISLLGYLGKAAARAGAGGA